MAAYVESASVATGIVGTEVVLASPTTSHVRAVAVNIVNLIAAEIVEIRAFAPLSLGGIQQLIEMQTFNGVATKPNTQIIACLMPYGGSFTIKQTNGSVRTFEWFIMVLDP